MGTRSVFDPSQCMNSTQNLNRALDIGNSSNKQPEVMRDVHVATLMMTMVTMVMSAPDKTASGSITVQYK